MSKTPRWLITVAGIGLIAGTIDEIVSPTVVAPSKEIRQPKEDATAPKYDVPFSTELMKRLDRYKDTFIYLTVQDVAEMDPDEALRKLKQMIQNMGSANEEKKPKDEHDILEDQAPSLFQLRLIVESLDDIAQVILQKEGIYPEQKFLHGDYEVKVALTNQSYMDALMLHYTPLPGKNVPSFTMHFRLFAPQADEDQRFPTISFPLPDNPFVSITDTFTNQHYLEAERRWRELSYLLQERIGEASWDRSLYIPDSDDYDPRDYWFTQNQRRLSRREFLEELRLGNRDFRDAIIEGESFTDIDLSRYGRLNFQGARIRESKFNNTGLRADLRNAAVSGAVFSALDLYGIKFDNKSRDLVIIVDN